MKRSFVSLRALTGALLSTGLVAFALTVAAPAAAEHGQADHAAHHEQGHHEAHGEHAEGAGQGEHGGHHDPHFSDINWFHGLIGEKEGAPPSLLWRAPGTPVPLGALLINSAVLFWLLIKFGGPGIKAALVDRKKRVASGIESAAAMKAEAEGQLEFYEEKLRKLDQEIEHIRTQMREQAEAERRRILAEAKSEREQLERDAHLLVQQELKVARQELFQAVVAEAVRSAEETIKKQVNEADQQRLADDFLATLDGALRAPGRRNVESRS
jgi:F-type H+-transporting ATPase subunit b